MKIESKTKSVKANGQQVILHRGKGEAWFLHREEAVYHRCGNTASEATALITGKGGMPRYPFAREGKKMNAIIFTREFRRFLEGSEYNANF